MRQMVVLTGAVAGGAVAWSRARRHGPGTAKPLSGIAHNGMAYARWGTGPGILLVIPGGPDNTPPAA